MICVNARSITTSMCELPSSLAAFALGLNGGELRRPVLANMCAEQGSENAGEPGD